jgi:hypothetical protein
MKKIYTGYYGNIRAYDGLQPVAISLGVPKWMPAIPNMRDLNPTHWMMNLDEDDYFKEYRGLLEKIDYARLIGKLSYLSGGKDAVLLCYEKPWLLCHRHIVAAWITEHGEFSVSEFYKPTVISPPEEKADKVEKEKEPEQSFLFELPPPQPKRRMWD